MTLPSPCPLHDARKVVRAGQFSCMRFAERMIGAVLTGFNIVVLQSLLMRWHFHSCVHCKRRFSCCLRCDTQSDGEPTCGPCAEQRFDAIIPQERVPKMSDMKTPAEQVRCAHEKVRPTFDYEASKGLSSHEVRQRWPRFFGECPDCRAPQLILYASKEHYYSGNW